MMRTNPFDDVERMLDRLSRSLDDMSHNYDDMDRVATGVGRLGGISVDVIEDDDEIVVTADVPGFATEDIDLTVSEDTLTIVAERETGAEQEGEHFLRRERSTQSMRRSIDLPAHVDQAQAHASYHNGVLTVTLPRLVTGEQRHRIEID